MAEDDFDAALGAARAAKAADEQRAAATEQRARAEAERIENDLARVRAAGRTFVDRAHLAGVAPEDVHIQTGTRSEKVRAKRGFWRSLIDGRVETRSVPVYETQQMWVIVRGYHGDGRYDTGEIGLYVLSDGTLVTGYPGAFDPYKVYSTGAAEDVINRLARYLVDHGA
jgi:hypothetical protein